MTSSQSAGPVLPVTRLLSDDDAPALAEVLRANRAFLAPWLPRRRDEWFTDAAQAAAVRTALQDHARGASVPLVVLDGDGRLVGTVTLQSVVRGFVQSCSVGYWLAEAAQGQGLATAAVREATQLAFDELRLHRVQAETLLANVRSQAVLDRLGFTRCREAPGFVKIAGRWQDCAFFQLLTPTPDLVQVPD